MAPIPSQCRYCYGCLRKEASPTIDTAQERQAEAKEMRFASVALCKSTVEGELNSMKPKTRSLRLFRGMFLLCAGVLAFPGPVIAQSQETAQPPRDTQVKNSLVPCLFKKFPETREGFITGRETMLFDSASGRNFGWDETKQAWIDVKTGEVICGRSKSALTFCLFQKFPGTKDSLITGRETTLFDHDSGRNFAWDEKKQAWIDTKTLECVCPSSCPSIVTPPTETTTTPPSAEDCDAAIKNISDLLGQFASTSESVGTVKQRIANSEIAKDIPPEEKKAALTADNAILKDKQQQALKLRGEIMDAWNVISRNKPCAKSGSQLRRLLDDLENKSQRFGGFQEALDRHIGLVDPKGLDAERNEAKSILNEIKDLVASCCAKKVSQNPPETFKQTEVFVGYQYERAPKELAKNLNGVNGQVFYDFAKHIGIGADFAWTTGSDRIGTTTDVTLHRFTGLFGPRFNIAHSLHNGSGKELIFHFPILIGFDHDSTKFQSSTISTSSSSTAFMTSFGANLDVMMTKNFGVRPIDFAYQPTHFGGNWQNNWKLGAGIVFMFGDRK